MINGSIFKDEACFFLSQSTDRKFLCTQSVNVANLTKNYSLAKYGGLVQLRFFSKKIIEKFENAIHSKIGPLWSFLSKLHAQNDHILLMSPGFRNIKASGNLMFDFALPYVNALLIKNRLPVLTEFKLVRLVDPCDNYAELSHEDRKRMSYLTDHELPGEELYRGKNIHVIYGDDIYITGESSNKVKFDTIAKGAKSFISLFAVKMDEKVVERRPHVEEELNRSFVSGRLDETAAEIFNQKGMIPVIRSHEILLCKANRDQLKDFLAAVREDNIFSVYRSYMSNEMAFRSEYEDSLDLVREFLYNKKYININGIPLFHESSL